MSEALDFLAANPPLGGREPTAIDYAFRRGGSLTIHAVRDAASKLDSYEQVMFMLNAWCEIESRAADQMQEAVGL
jgi:hypothetical protein